MKNNVSFVSTLLIDNANFFDVLTKSIIKKMSCSDKWQVSETCTEIMLDNYHDEIVNDLIQEVTLAVLENDKTTYTFNDDSSVDFGTYETIDKNGETIERPFFFDLMGVISNYLYKNKGITANHTPIDDFEIDNEEDTITVSPHDRKKYIRAITDNLSLSSINGVLDNVDEFKDFISKNYPKQADEFNTFINWLVFGYFTIDEIAVKMGITKTRAYYINKTLRKYYCDGTAKVQPFNHIDRKTIVFAPFKSNNGVNYKRVIEHDSTLTIGGKSHKVKTMTTPIYTRLENRFDETTKKVSHVHVSCGGFPVLKDDLMPKKRSKKYVINVTKKALSMSIDGCTYRKSDSSANGSYQFCYGDNLAGKAPLENSIVCISRVRKVWDVKKMIYHYVCENIPSIGYSAEQTYHSIAPQTIYEPYKEEQAKTMILSEQDKKWLSKQEKRRKQAEKEELNHDSKCYHTLTDVKHGSFYF